MTIRCPKCAQVLAPPQQGEGDLRPGTPPDLSSVSCPKCGTVSVPQDLDSTILHRQLHEPQQAQSRTRVGHFQLDRLLGHGSAGDVWLADDITLDRQVALKLPRSRDPETMSLLTEAKTAASLRHPHIVSVYEIGLEADQVFIASEFIDGLTLRDLLSAGKPAIDRSMDLLMRIATALHYAHQQGVVHRDVKPANILLNKEGQPYVTDFGLAKRLNSQDTISSQGQVVGTARYMSPEQARGLTHETDHRADVYALGVMMFEMLTGEVPFRGNIRALLEQKVNHDAPSPRTLDPALPRDLETICLKCLERDPEKRYASALEFAEELTRFTVGEPIHARPISRLERVWRWCRMRPAIAGLLAGLFLSLSFGLLGVTFFWQQAAQNARQSSQSLYRSRMNLASVHLGHGDIVGVREMLDGIAADPYLASLRGFEWNYFARLTADLVPVANHGDVVSDVAVSRDGTICASIGRDRQIRIWDAGTGESVRSLAVDDSVIFQSIDFSPTTLHLASGSSDGFVRVWNPLQDGRVMQQMQHGPQVVLVRYSPDGKRLLAAGNSGAVRIWDSTNGTLLAEVPTGQRGLTKDVRFFTDNRRIAVASEDGHLRIWDLDRFQTAPGPELQLDSGPNLEALAVSDDGQLLVTGSYHGTLTLHSLTDRDATIYKSTWGRIDDLEFVGGTLLAAIANDGRLHLLDMLQQREIRTLNSHGLTTGSLVRSANGKSLLVGSGDGSVTLVKTDGLNTPTIVWHEQAVRDLEFLPDGTRLIAADDGGHLRIWDLATGQSESFSPRDSRPTRSISLQPGGRLLAGAATEPNATLWDIETRTIVRELRLPPTGALAVLFSPSGDQLAVATRKGPVRLYSTKDWDQPYVEFSLPEGKVNALAFSAQRTIAVAAVGGVWLFDSFSGKPRAQPIVLKSEPTALQFCEADRILAIGTGTGEIQFWDMSSNRRQNLIKGHTARINALATLPGSRTLISGGRDRQLKLWDISSGELIAPLSGHYRQVFTIAVNPRGEVIASGGLEGDVRLWHAQP